MLIVGLTGGIGSGKSAASRRFEQLGIKVVDADIVARQVVEPGKPALKTIANQFGDEILDQDGALNRTKLREIIFNDTNARRWLEALLHPIIRSEIIRELSLANSPYAILVSPLLFEAKQHQLCGRTLLIDLPETLQRARASKRDETSEEAIQKIIDSQMSREDKQRLASDIICNDRDLGALEGMVDSLHEKYLELASEKS